MGDEDGKALLRLPSQRRSGYSMHAREFFRDNRLRYGSAVDTVKAMVERWRGMPALQKKEYVERSMAAASEDMEPGSDDVEEGICNERMAKKLGEYVRSRKTYRWEYSGFLWFVDELFGICGDMSVSPEENVRMFAAMWREVGDEEQGRYRRRALDRWSKEKKCRGRGKRDR